MKVAYNLIKKTGSKAIKKYIMELASGNIEEHEDDFKFYGISAEELKKQIADGKLDELAVAFIQKVIANDVKDDGTLMRKFQQFETQEKQKLEGTSNKPPASPETVPATAEPTQELETSEYNASLTLVNDIRNTVLDMEALPDDQRDKDKYQQTKEFLRRSQGQVFLLWREEHQDRLPDIINTLQEQSQSVTNPEILSFINNALVPLRIIQDGEAFGEDLLWAGLEGLNTFIRNQDTQEVEGVPELYASLKILSSQLLYKNLNAYGLTLQEARQKRAINVAQSLALETYLNENGKSIIDVEAYDELYKRNDFPKIGRLEIKELRERNKELNKEPEPTAVEPVHKRSRIIGKDVLENFILRYTDKALAPLQNLERIAGEILNNPSGTRQEYLQSIKELAIRQAEITYELDSITALEDIDITAAAEREAKLRQVKDRLDASMKEATRQAKDAHDKAITATVEAAKFNKIRNMRLAIQNKRDQIRQ